ncbi:MAG: sugar-binding domain-containing protein [Sphaerochaeta sp.]|nr:sugar-binding domain-containing protein [Sphaerochaeta sp.]
MLHDRELLYSIASLYYEKGKNQQEISNYLNISRPMVSRALAKAQQLGMVRIEIIPPAGCSSMELSLARALGIKRVVIGQCPSDYTIDRDNRIRAIATSAGEFLSQTVTNGMTVGVGWGVSVYRSILSLPEIPSLKGVTVVPMVGSAGRTESHFQVNVIADRMAEKLHGNALFFNIPAFVSDFKVRDFFARDPQMKAIQDLWNHIDIAIVGLGAFGGTPSFPIGEYPIHALEELQEQQVIGDILGRFFNAEGFIGDIPTCDSLISRQLPDTNGKIYLGIPVDSIKRSKQVVCLAGGKLKIPAIRTAAKLKLFDSLITDSQTAQELAQSLE